jgi:hypothetical protein
MNSCPINVQAYENNVIHVEKHMLITMCVLRILVTNDTLWPFSKYNVRMCSFLQEFAAHLKPYGDTPIANILSLVCPVQSKH